MAVSVKTPWRNAACVMFLAGPFRFSRPPQRLANPPAISYTPYIQYESRGTPQPELLFVKRHSKSGFMANTHVFPGGVLDEADYSPSWFPLFAEMSNSRTDSTHPFNSITSLKPRSLSLYSLGDGPIAGEVAFRICAIRELFEEAGVLLVRDKGEVASLVGVVPGTCSPAVKELPQVEMKEWRHKVHNNAHEFITLCRELNCVPDIWSLVEWSNWLTPRNQKRRYNTVFFMCYSDSKPDSSPDLIEVTSASWMSPSTAVDSFRSGKVMFAPPQFAEVACFERIGQVPLLHLYALHKSVREDGVMQRRSCRIRTKDGALVSVTERDDLSPLEGPEDWITPIQHPQALGFQKEGVSFSLSLDPMWELEIPTHTVEELREMSRVTDRIEFHSRSNFSHISSVMTEDLETFFRQVTEPPSKL